MWCRHEQGGNVTEQRSHLRGALKETISSLNARRNVKCKSHANSMKI